MFQRTKVSTGVRIALGFAVGVSAMPAFAQAVDRVEITGSLIRKIDSETSLATTTLKADDLQRVGATNAEQVVKFITQQQGGTVTSGSVSGTNGAAAYADLRSLGANRTLVLLNGKRVVPNPFSSAAVDLNTMPTGALDRVETLADGASSTYGTDAVAGVINFITRKSFSGFSIDGQAQVTQHGGGDVYTGNVLAGFGNLASSGWNVYGALNVRQMKPMNGTEREFMKTSYQPQNGFNGLSPTTFPANYSQTGTIANTNPSLAGGCQAPSSIAAPEANGTTIRCFADTQIFTNVVPEQDQWGAYLKGSLALGSNHVASLEYYKSFNKVKTTIAPSPEGGLTMTPLSPYYPGNGVTPISNPALNPANNLAINWRTTVLGSRQGLQENNTQRAVMALSGGLGSWDYDVAMLWSNSTVENYFLNGYPTTTALRNGVQGINGAPFLNPFGDQSPAGLAYMQANTVLGKVQDGEGTLSSATASASTTFAKLPGGPIGLALGTEFRKEEMVYNTNIALVSQAASSGLAGSGATRAGDRDVTAFAAELSMPVLKNLEFNLSVRADKYSDFGNTTNPKVSFKAKPIDMILVRGSYNEGFSAPTLTSLYAPNATTFTANRYNDPVLCPGGVVAANGTPARDCGIQFQRLTGGNTALKAEQSKAWSLGFVVQPLESLTVAVDFWDYWIKDSISTIGEQSVFADPVKYAGLFVRCSQAPAARQAAIGACQNPGAADPLAYIVDTNANLGDVQTSGVDVQVLWSGVSTSFGRFNGSVRGTYVDKYDFQVEPGGRWFDPVGKYSPQFAGPVIRYQQVTTFGWDTQATSLRLSNRFQTGYRDQNAQGAPFNVAPFNTRVVDSYNTWDISVAYNGIKGLNLSVGVLNLLDKDPSFTNQTGRFQARGYDDRFHNPLGRTYQVSAKYQF